MKRFVISLFILANFLLGYAQPKKREFRGVWIATVGNIDWPSRPGLSVDEQKAEIINILDSHQAIGINAIIFQVRPAADAFYHSKLEPWSRWLNGKLNKYPNPFYDPLSFIIRETHVRGMEFHAWFNPYRAFMNFRKEDASEHPLIKAHPDWFLEYGENIYFDPGKPEARNHTTQVILDVVRRYDIDAVHFDDYFYPYKISGLDFPDSASFKLYGASFPNRDDWRRNNVNELIKTLSDSIKGIKPYVQFGISPFGIWRNSKKDSVGSLTNGGQTCYDDLYADIKKWVEEGWLDYSVPQLYWNIGHKAAPYEILVEWWSRHSGKANLYIGHGAYRAGNNNDSTWIGNKAIVDQLLLNRKYDNVAGSVFFSSKSITRNNGGVTDYLMEKEYYYGALNPVVINHVPSEASDVMLNFLPAQGGLRIFWNASHLNLSSHTPYILYRFNSKEKVDTSNAGHVVAIIPANPQSGTQFVIDNKIKRRRKYLYAVTQVDIYNNESIPQQYYPVKTQKRSWRTYPPVPAK